ncbi:MAG TPA: hypothetical protein DCR40_01200 [Prolixibacteraceae bacterium]|nr:hypothetical protein [Prolixibacteraceae bacterium]
MSHFRIFTILAILNSAFFSVSAQKTTMLFSKSLLNKTGRSMEIELTDSLGNSEINSDFFNQSDLIFFTVKPIPGQNWTFSKNEAENKLTELKLAQDNIVLPVKRLKSVNQEKDIVKVIVTYNKNSINVLRMFRFKFDEADSEPIAFPETLWPNYKVYNVIIDKSKELLNKNELLGSFKCLIKLWNTDKNFSEFSFYPASIESLNKLVEQNLTQSKDSLLKGLTRFQKKPTEKNLDRLHSLNDTLLNNLNTLESFLNTTREGIIPENFLKTIDAQKVKISKEFAAASQLFRKSMLRIFEEKNYSDYKFKLYTEVLSNLLISVDKIKPLKSLDNIYISKLRKYSDQKSELTDMGWYEDFTIICRLLNDNIHSQSYLFRDSVMINYAKNKSSETQPYYTVLRAYDSLVKKDKTKFIRLINECLTTVTDRDMLANLDLTISLASIDSLTNESYWDVVQKGYDSYLIGSYPEAKKHFEKAEKLSESNEVLFFLMGETSYKLLDRYSSEIYFNRALATNPKFIMPKLFRIEFLTEDKDYATAISLVNSALETNPIWYFYFKKAILLQLSGKNDEAKAILLNDCIKMNSRNYDQYIVLGDIYLALNDIKSARENFMIAGDLNPNDNQYKKRMELLKQLPEKPAGN